MCAQRTGSVSGHLARTLVSQIPLLLRQQPRPRDGQSQPRGGPENNDATTLVASQFDIIILLSSSVLGKNQVAGREAFTWIALAGRRELPVHTEL